VASGTLSELTPTLDEGTYTWTARGNDGTDVSNNSATGDEFDIRDCGYDEEPYSGYSGYDEEPYSGYSGYDEEPYSGYSGYDEEPYSGPGYDECWTLPEDDEVVFDLQVRQSDDSPAPYAHVAVFQMTFGEAAAGDDGGFPLLFEGEADGDGVISGAVPLSALDLEDVVFSPESGGFSFNSVISADWSESEESDDSEVAIVPIAMSSDRPTDEVLEVAEQGEQVDESFEPPPSCEAGEEEASACYLVTGVSQDSHGRSRRQPCGPSHCRYTRHLDGGVGGTSPGIRVTATWVGGARQTRMTVPYVDDGEIKVMKTYVLEARRRKQGSIELEGGDSNVLGLSFIFKQIEMDVCHPGRTVEKPCPRLTAWVPWKFIGVVTPRTNYHQPAYLNSSTNIPLRWAKDWTRRKHQIKAYPSTIRLRNHSIRVLVKSQYGAFTTIRYEAVAGCDGRRIISGSNGMHPKRSPIVHAYCVGG
jgi:hypothetical protein